MPASPSGGERRALVAVTFHSFIVLDENHVKVPGEVLKGVPLFFELLNLAELLYSGEVRRGGAYYGFLLGAVYNELPAEHGDIGVDFGLVLVPGALGMERVGGGVEANEAFAGSDGTQKLLFTFGGHGRSLRFVGLGEVAAGVEGDGIVLVEVSIEDAAIFGADDFEAVAFTQLGEDSIGDAGLAILDFDGIVLEAG